MKTLTYIIFSLMSIFANGQKITGRITNRETGEPVPFANVMIVGKNLNTVSDSLGNFTVIISNDFDKGRLQFSSIGYEQKSVKLRKTISKNRQDYTVNIRLVPKTYQIPEVVVYGQRSTIARINRIKNSY